MLDVMCLSVLQNVVSPHTLQGLVPSNTYSVYVVAVNQFGVSDPSAIVSFQLLSPGDYISYFTAQYCNAQFIVNFIYTVTLHCRRVLQQT